MNRYPFMKYEEVTERIASDDEGNDISYPLAKVVGGLELARFPFVVYGFGIIALFGMIASYHGMIYGTSRQAFALGRAGYLPTFLGNVHSQRRTPIASLAICSLITAASTSSGLDFGLFMIFFAAARRALYSDTISRRLSFFTILLIFAIFSSHLSFVICPSKD